MATSAARARSIWDSSSLVWTSEPSAEARRQRISSVARSIWAMRLAAARWNRLTIPQASSSASSSSAVSGKRAKRSDQIAASVCVTASGSGGSDGAAGPARSIVKWPSSSCASWAARVVCMTRLPRSTPEDPAPGARGPGRAACPHRRKAAGNSRPRLARAAAQSAATRAEGRRVAGRRGRVRGPSGAGAGGNHG